MKLAAPVGSVANDIWIGSGRDAAQFYQIIPCTNSCHVVVLVVTDISAGVVTVVVISNVVVSVVVRIVLCYAIVATVDVVLMI